MAGSPWLLLPLLVLPELLGLVLLGAAGVRLTRAPLLALGAAYGAGAFAIAAMLFATVALAVPMTRPGVLLAALGMVWLATLVRRREPVPAELGRGGVLGRAAMLLAVRASARLVVAWAIEGNVYAITTNDEATHYFAKSCELIDVGRFGPRYARALADGVVGAPDYPLLNPLLQVHAHLWNGGIAHVDARLPIQAFMLALVAALGGALARSASPLLAAVLTPLVILTDAGRVISQSAMADGLVAFGLLLATEGCLARHRGDERGAAPLFALGLAIAIWAKNEGTMLAAAMLLANARALWRSPERRWAWTWLALPLGTLVVHLCVNALHGFSYYLVADYGSGGILARFCKQVTTHGAAVARTFASELLVPGTCTNGLFAALLLLAVLAPGRLLRNGCLAPALALGAGIAAFAVVMIGTGTDLGWSLQTATPRLWFQMTPAAALLLGAALADRGRVSPPLGSAAAAAAEPR